MGSAAMDQNGDLALGFSASSSSINPQIRYAGRLVSDPINQLAQGEARTARRFLGFQDGTGFVEGMKCVCQFVEIIAKKVRAVFISDRFQHQAKVQQVLCQRALFRRRQT